MSFELLAKCDSRRKTTEREALQRRIKNTNVAYFPGPLCTLVESFREHWGRKNNREKEKILILVKGRRRESEWSDRFLRGA